MASEIHKKRTGKSFRIDEDIVRKEEMYEEEEDDFPRSYRVLGPHMQTASAEMNSKLEAYVSSRLAMSAYMSQMNDSWRENNINQMFAAAFPNLGQQAQQLHPQQGAGSQSPMSPSFQQLNYQQDNDRSQSFSTMSPIDNGAENSLSPSTLTHASTPKSSGPLKETIGFSHPVAAKAVAGDFGRSTESPFTTELPQEMKLLMGGPSGMDMTGFGSDTTGFGSDMYGQAFMPTNGMYDPAMMTTNKLGELETGVPDMYGDDSWDTMAQSLDEPWDTFINDAAWDTNLQ